MHNLARAKGIKGTFGKHLIIPTTEPLPSDFSERIIAALRTGDRFAQQTHTEDVRKAIRIGKKWVRVVLNESQRYPWANACTSAFWFAASFRASKLGRIGVLDSPIAYYGARAQRDLTSALLGLTAADREMLFHFLDKGTLKDHWRATYTGAMAVAQIAKALNDIGLKVIIPSIHVDMFHKIDLFVELPAESKIYLCLQVKRIPEDVSEARLLSAGDNFEHQYGRLDKATLDAVNEFAQEYGLTCLTAAVRLSRRQTPWVFDLPANIQNEFLSLQQSFARTA